MLDDYPLFAGFPLSKRERDILDRLLQTKGGAALQSRGAARPILYNLIGRGWIIRTERIVDFAAETYAITVEGELARELDRAALAARQRRSSHLRPAGRNAYKHLRQRLAIIRNSN